jgi:sugar phosphate isomerase/epimerase
MKDTGMFLNGRTSILGSHLPFGHPDRSWEFRSPGRGDVNFEAIIRELNRLGYAGPLAVEWEDTGMDREHGAREALDFVRRLDFRPTALSFEDILA